MTKKFSFSRKQGALALAFLLMMSAIFAPCAAFAAETPAKIYPTTIDWASVLTPEAYAATPDEWKDFTYNDLLNIPAEQNHGWDTWSYVENYHRGDGLILRVAELYFDQSGLGLEQIQTYRRDVVELCLADIRVKIEPTLLSYLPDRGEEYREYNIWNKQEEVNALLDSIPGLAESNTDTIIFWNDGGWSYEPGMVTYKGKKYWVISLDHSIEGGRGIHDIIQTLQCKNTVNTMDSKASILYNHTIQITDPEKLAKFQALILQMASPFFNWGWSAITGISRNEAYNYPPELGVPTDDRPIWTPQSADAFYGSQNDEDFSAYQGLMATYDRVWLQFQPRTAALDVNGNEIDRISALVRDLRGLKPGDPALPTRA